MIPRLDIQFPLHRQWLYWFGKQYEPSEGEYLLNHARAGIVLALKAALPNGGRVGVVAYNCHTVANAVVNAGSTPVFIDVTDELKINTASIPADLDAIVVTNLFGIRNDISAIRERCPKAIIIVDNAHGFGLLAEGDFTVYSINQGKFPALGPGGILVVRSQVPDIKSKIASMYATLPSYGVMARVKLFMQMTAKAIAYSGYLYWLTMKVKEKRGLGKEKVREKIVMHKMAPGIRKLYHAWLPSADENVAKQCFNAESILNKQSHISNIKYIYGANAFMLIAHCEDPEALQREFARRCVETETHFKHAIDWAHEFGYIPGSCPKTEELTKHLLMIPTYKKI